MTYTFADSDRPLHEPARPAGPVSTGLRCLADGAFSQIGEVAGSGREVTVVMEHNEVMVHGAGADQQVNG
jgi:hypothetical protein